MRIGDESEIFRSDLLDIAGKLLATAGPHTLSIRRIATEAGCSTTYIYTLFGTKEGLVEALYLEGFDRFRRYLEAVPRRSDPVDYVIDIGNGYRRAALANPDHYGLMFEKTIPGFVPSERARTIARASLNILDRAVAECVAAGRGVGPASPQKIADTVWAAAHGAISLERAGHLQDGDTYETVTMAAVSHFLTKTR
ncbi:TetR/AcrR family transcriptional regulator [Rhizohabitans arisaemae]|uniref:TetR/AcrR family transcriptional regulator n=1 Tax=Rhizohabitans arisaemae TaxID=2720610 RepID=UPI0024B247DB|nr:TetR/AcrR family transcriptional regulator [Rhizohabitans arisaemae]